MVKEEFRFTEENRNDYLYLMEAEVYYSGLLQKRKDQLAEKHKYKRQEDLDKLPKDKKVQQYEEKLSWIKSYWKKIPREERANQLAASRKKFFKGYYKGWKDKLKGRRTQKT